MEIKTLRVTKWEKDNIKGFATVVVDLGEETLLTLNNITIREFQKDGEAKIAAFLPSRKKDDGKYEDYVSMKGPFWWSINDAILAELTGKEAPKREDAPAAVAKTATAKAGYTTPFRPR